MSVARYYILESDTTTAGGIVQKTTNPLSFKVYGKEQSHVGDDVWYPACGSMGKIAPAGPRLNTSVGGHIPALNDDLCLCKCSPPPKLINSQTSFKEIIDDNTLTKYQQVKEQYLQSKQNSITNTAQTDDDELPNFTVHFRRPDDYQGEYGFDWLRDEYVYNVSLADGSVQGNIVGVSPYRANLIQPIMDEYITYQNSPVSFIDDFIFNQSDYVPAWLSIFAKGQIDDVYLSNVNLHLQIEQDETHGSTPLTDDGTMILFECSQGLEAQSTLTLADYLKNAKRQKIELVASSLAMSSKKIYRYTNTTFSINIACTQPIDELGYVKIFAQKPNGKKKQVGLLCVYPNNDIPTAVIQPVVWITTHNLTMISHPQSILSVGRAFIPYGKIQTALFNQALIKAQINDYLAINLPDKKVYIGAKGAVLDIPHSLDQEISNYLTQYPPQANVSDQSILMDTRNLYHNIISNIPELSDKKQKFHQTTHIVFTDYPKKYQEGNTIMTAHGEAEPIGKNPMDCTLGGCTYWGNFCLTYDRPNNDEGLRTTVHELGHTLGLEHTFNDASLFLLRQGLTDNLLDYTKDEFGNDSPYLGKQWALFKWQWDIIHKDNHLIKYYGAF